MMCLLCWRSNIYLLITIGYFNIQSFKICINAKRQLLHFLNFFEFDNNIHFFQNLRNLSTIHLTMKPVLSQLFSISSLVKSIATKGAKHFRIKSIIMQPCFNPNWRIMQKWSQSMSPVITEPFTEAFRLLLYAMPTTIGQHPMLPPSARCPTQNTSFGN